MNAKTKSTKTPSIAPAVKLAKKMKAERFGTCDIVRVVAHKFPTLRRRDVLAVTKTVGINPGTASRQFQETRAGHFDFA
jgi:hypothetical protein